MFVAELILAQQEFLTSLLLVFLRVGGLMTVVPGFADRSVPVRFRLVLAGAFSVICLGSMPDFAAIHSLTLTSLPLRVLAEILIGVFLGLGLRFLIFALQMAGTIAAQSMSLSQLFGGSQEDPMPTIGHILTFAALALLMAGGFHVKLAMFIISSYGWLPFGAVPTAEDVVAWALGNAGTMMNQAFVLAAPFMIVSILYNLTLGVINKAMPQLMVALVGAPAVTWAAIALLMIASPLMLGIWLVAVDKFLASPVGGP